jgi:branched-chain amino acid transport system permease protein
MSQAASFGVPSSSISFFASSSSVSEKYSVKYSMGTTFGNKAMTAAVMGGFGSLPGAMLGSVLLGIVESLCSLYISTAYKDVFSFVILVIVLFCRPQGILGKKSITKV